MSAAARARPSLRQGLVVFGSVQSVLGPGSVLDRRTRDALGSLRAEGIEVIVVARGVSGERELADFLDLSCVELDSSADGLAVLAASLGVPYWRTAAIGDSAADLPLLQAASLPFWVDQEPFPGSRGAVQLPRGDVLGVSRRLLGAWLPEVAVAKESRQRRAADERI